MSWIWRVLNTYRNNVSAVISVCMGLVALPSTAQEGSVDAYLNDGRIMLAGLAAMSDVCSGSTEPGSAQAIWREMQSNLDAWSSLPTPVDPSAPQNWRLSETQIKTKALNEITSCIQRANKLLK